MLADHLTLSAFARPAPRTASAWRARSTLELLRRAVLVAALVCLPMLHGQEQPLAFTGAQVLTITGETFDRGVLIGHQGKITAVGPASTPIPADATVRDVTGQLLLPGLVDTHSHIGEVALGESSAPIQPDLRVLDSLNVRDATLQRAQAGGITTANIMPGSGMLVSGQTLYVKLREGNSIDDLLIKDAEGRVAGGLKMANGTNSRRDPPFPGTRGKSAALVRERFVAAQEYRDKIARAKGDAEKLPARDLALEILAEVLDGKRVVHHHTHRHDDILTVLRLQKEFGFRVVLQHVSEAWKVVDEIVAAKTPCSIILVDSPGGKLETRDIAWQNGAVLEKAGVLTALHTDDYITDSRLFLRSAGLAVRAGMSRQAALRALTIAPAQMLDLQNRVGSLEVGKDADFLLLSGDPLSVYSHVLETWIEGKKVFDRADPKDRLWATGGYGAGNPRAAHLCCFGSWEDER
ncbi:MAG: amidohydrolase family protein [Verrucomicrobia bacterium]|nr:amidohydrolase family protein [Verrucomicrobiota bacterium]